MKKIITIILFIYLIPVFSQEKEIDFEELFWNAETEYYDDNFNEALFLFLDIEKKGLKNPNIDNLIGECYVRSDQGRAERLKSIPYLKNASNNISDDYQEDDVREEKANIRSLIYLGDAYLLADSLELAIETYNMFLEKNTEDPKYYTTIVDRKIATCESAKILKKLTIKTKIKNLGEVINNGSANYDAVMSGDGNMLVYTSDMKFYQSVLYSQKVNGEFTSPKSLNYEAKVEGSMNSVGISFDGKEVYLFKKNLNSDEGNIFTSVFDGTKWSELKKLPKPINTKYLERHASPSKDGKTLYFTSNRRGGEGSLDIYKSEKLKNGKWGRVENLGETINTEFDEMAPFILNDNKTLYFSSQGHYYNMGGNDIFITRLKDDNTWSTPLNFGYPLNTTGEDIFLFPSDKDNKALISKEKEDGFGNLDIYEITFLTKDISNIKLTGNFDNNGKEINIRVEVNGKFIAEAKSNKEAIVSVEITPSAKINVLIVENEIDDEVKNKNLPKIYCQSTKSIDNEEIKERIEKEIKEERVKEIAKKEEERKEAESEGFVKNEELLTNSANKTYASTILFGFDKSITSQHKEDLNKVAKYLNSVDNVLVEIQGYADIQGDANYNLRLSKRRAQFVMNYLLSQSVDKNKMRIKAFGESNPVSINLNPTTRKYNRRVQFKVITDEVGKLEIRSMNLPEEYRIKSK